MKKHQSLDLKYIMMLYNLFQVVSNSVLAVYVSLPLTSKLAIMISSSVLGRQFLFREAFVQLPMSKCQLRQRRSRHNRAETILLIFTAESAGSIRHGNTTGTNLHVLSHFTTRAVKLFQFLQLLYSLLSCRVEFNENLFSKAPTVEREEKKKFKNFLKRLTFMSTHPHCDENS